MSNLTRAMMMGAAGASGDPVYVDDVFSTYLHAGENSSSTINNGIDLSGEGGLVWVKSRTETYNHWAFDTERGATKQLTISQTYSEATEAKSVTAFNSNGFNIGGSGGDCGYNCSGQDFVYWTFRKAPGFFDVVTYTGNGSAQNLSHSLGSVPGMIIVKKINASERWYVYHRSLDSSAPQNYYLSLNETFARQANAAFWTTAPTSSVFTIGENISDNNDTYVAYIFAHDDQSFGTGGNESIIKCGSFSGTGFVNLGWEPQWLLIKPYNQTYNWELYDNIRGVGQPAGLSSANALFPNTNGAEAGTSGISFEATGFTQTTFGATYPCIYIAIRRPHKPPTAGTEVFKALTDTHTQSVRSITGVGFSPDLLINLVRSNANYGQHVVDRMRGPSLVLYTEYTSSENTQIYAVTSFDQDGITMGNGQAGNGINSYSGYTSAKHFFRRAPGFMDVVAYAGTGSSQNVTHNLGVIPKLMLIKARNVAQQWMVYTSAIDGSNDYLVLNSTNAKADSSLSLPTSTSIVLNTSSGLVNGSGTNYISYLFATLAGISKVGTYSGTGSDVNVDCGFTSGARFVMIKRTDVTIVTGDWYVYDSARGIVSGNDPYILLNSAAAEVTNTDYIDPLNAGFTVTSSAPAGLNASGGTFLFLAIA